MTSQPPTSDPGAHNAWSFVLFRIVGIQVEVHVTFLLAIAWVGVSLVRKGATVQTMWHVLLLGVCVAASILLHELGHALTARKLGLKTREISLTPMGGVSNLEVLPENPRLELPIVLAGPAVSLLLAGGLWAIVLANGTLGPPRHYLDTEANLLCQLMWLNLVLALYNLLPILPMDGGRAVRAVLGFFLPYSRATRIAGRFAQGLSVVLAIFGLTHSPIFLFTAVWIWMNARREVTEVRTRHALKDFSVRDVLVSGPTLSADAPLKDASHAFISTFQPEFPVMRGTDVVGVMGFEELLKGLKEHGEEAAISAAMRHEFNGVDVGMPLDEVMGQMKESDDELVMVTDNDRYVGVLPRTNLHELIRVQQALKKVG